MDPQHVASSTLRGPSSVNIRGLPCQPCQAGLLQKMQLLIPMGMMPAAVAALPPEIAFVIHLRVLIVTERWGRLHPAFCTAMHNHIEG